MDSLTGLDDDEDFFGNYDADRFALSSTPLEFDEAEPQTAEQRAHLARFRRPVAAVVASMALLSIIALGRQGSVQHDAQRALVAHYGSAIASPTPTAIVPKTVKRAAAVSEASSALVPEALSALVTEALSSLVPEALPSARAAAPAPVVEATALEPSAPDNTVPLEISIDSDSDRPSAFVAALTQTCPR